MEYESILKRRLTPTHLALVRGWVQGIELSELAPRFLAGVGDDDGVIDLRLAKTSLVRVLNELAFTAKRVGLKGASTLYRQASRIRTDATAPSLEDFADSLENADFYNEDELIELYQEKYKSPSSGRILARRARLIDRQLSLLTDISHHLSAPISLHDPIDTWFDDSIAQRLVEGGFTDIEGLAKAIVINPLEWHAPVPGIGHGKGQRIQRFLSCQFGPLDDVLARAGVRVSVESERPAQPSVFRTLLLPSPPPGILATSSLNWEVTDDAPSAEDKVNSLDGSQGRLRGQPELAATSAKNDQEALEVWLRLKNSGKTKALYRREIERLIMWATGVKRIALSSLTIEDALDYCDFLANVPANWIGKKGTPLHDRDWRPFAGSLTPKSVGKTLVIVKGFFKWMVDSNYMTANPFANVKVQSALPSVANTSASDESSLLHATEVARTIHDRTLPFAARRAVEKELSEAVQDQFIIRVRFIFNLSILCGLRISEIATARRQNLTYVEATSQSPGGWELLTIGKFNKARRVPLPDIVISDLCRHLSDRGLSNALANVDPGVYLVGCSPSHTVRTKVTDPDPDVKHKQPGDGVTPFAIHRALRKLFTRAATRAEPGNPESIKKLFDASAHWLRHTFGTDATEHGVPLVVLRDVLGHANISTTSLYVHTSLGRRRAELGKYWEQQGGPEAPS